MFGLTIIQTIFAIFFSVLAILIIFMMIFGNRPSSKGYWEDLIKIAINSKASSLLLEIGYPARWKIDDKWRDNKFTLINLKEFNYLKSLIQSQPDVWILPGVGTANVIRNEDAVIEFELKADRSS